MIVIMGFGIKIKMKKKLMLVEIATKVSIWFSAMVSIIFHPQIFFILFIKNLILVLSGLLFCPTHFTWRGKKKRPLPPQRSLEQ